MTGTEELYFILRANAKIQVARFSKMPVFWNVAPCIHEETDRRFRCAHCLHQPIRTDDGDSKHLWNVGQTSSWSYAPPLESEISLNYIIINFLFYNSARTKGINPGSSTFIYIQEIN
jgi:hypothetical protein